MPTTTPIQFEPEALRQSVQRMLAYQPECMYLTHYGRIGNVQQLGTLLLRQMDAMVAFSVALPDDAQRHAALVKGFGEQYRRSLKAHGCTLAAEYIDELLSLDCELNAQGMAVWLNRKTR